jgi:SseB protein C-terminal domain
MGETKKMKNNFLIGLPRKKPDELILLLKKEFLKIPKIKSAYFGQICRHPFTELPHLLLALELNGNLEEILNILQPIMQNNIERNEYVEICSLEIKEFADYFSKLKPFYVSTQ